MSEIEHQLVLETSHSNPSKLCSLNQERRRDGVVVEESPREESDIPEYSILRRPENSAKDRGNLVQGDVNEYLENLCYPHRRSDGRKPFVFVVYGGEDDWKLLERR
jgi:hypothetical protein